ncbi:uncharacterized protein N7459_007273 [Penicillium hispanicum]|uniref:uncharacterized protein n=1 Tax=Penicillium hispanicum TaxID=1080232 RepID=UPI0025414087|nr:uncharacterized protein N7459_007273 [Penicillium hispanicum]KAJ5578309.1 hypothetical protein N7459_007273 [Penicillium hispanicum]
MSLCASIYPGDLGPYSWLDAKTREKAPIDSWTFGVQKITTTASPCGSSGRLSCKSLVKVPCRHSGISLGGWLRMNTRIWANQAFEPVPIDDIEDIEAPSDISENEDDDDTCAISKELGPGPVQLEAIPPYPKQSTDNSLFSTHRQTRQSVFTELFDPRSYVPRVDEFYTADHPVQESASLIVSDSAAAAVDSSSLASTKPGCVRITRKTITRKLQKAVMKTNAVYRALRGRLG